MAWPTTNDPRTEFVTLRLTVGESADLDAYAARKGMKRSEAVRNAVDRVIAAEKKRAQRQARTARQSQPSGRAAERTNDEEK